MLSAFYTIYTKKNYAMLLTINSTRSLGRKRGVLHTRNLWQWLNIIFNRVDEDRKKTFGADRTCAEWLLKNGGKVRWKGSNELLDDYNKLPPEGTVLYIQEVDATESSIMHYGFAHFIGCNHIEKMILHRCKYLEDPALQMMQPLQENLHHLQVSSCHNITAKGVKALGFLNKLNTLILFDLPYVKNKKDVFADLKTKLASDCEIRFD